MKSLDSDQDSAVNAFRHHIGKDVIYSTTNSRELVSLPLVQNRMFYSTRKRLIVRSVALLGVIGAIVWMMANL